LSRGQSLVELAVCAPLVTLLALGTVTLVQLAEAREGLEAATQAAVDAAARAPDAAGATAAARERFVALVGGYPLMDPTLRVSLGDFERGGVVVADSTASVDLGWGGFLGLPGRVVLVASAETRIEEWRSRAPSP